MEFDILVFKECLRSARIARGFTQAEFAKKIGVSPATESNYESRKNDAIPDIKVFRDMLEVLDASESYFLAVLPRIAKILSAFRTKLFAKLKGRFPKQRKLLIY